MKAVKTCQPLAQPSFSDLNMESTLLIFVSAPLEKRSTTQLGSVDPLTNLIISSFTKKPTNLCDILQNFVMKGSQSTLRSSPLNSFLVTKARDLA